MDDERHPHVDVEVSVLGKLLCFRCKIIMVSFLADIYNLVFAQRPTVVSQQSHHRGGGLAALPEGFQDQTNLIYYLKSACFFESFFVKYLVIHVACGRVVVLPDEPGVVVRHWAVGEGEVEGGNVVSLSKGSGRKQEMH